MPPWVIKHIFDCCIMMWFQDHINRKIKQDPNSCLWSEPWWEGALWRAVGGHDEASPNKSGGFRPHSALTSHTEHWTLNTHWTHTEHWTLNTHWTLSHLLNREREEANCSLQGSTCGQRFPLKLSNSLPVFLSLFPLLVLIHLEAWSGRGRGITF